MDIYKSDSAKNVNFVVLQFHLIFANAICLKMSVLWTCKSDLAENISFMVLQIGIDFFKLDLTENVNFVVNQIGFGL